MTDREIRVYKVNVPHKNRWINNDELVLSCWSPKREKGDKNKQSPKFTQRKLNSENLPLEIEDDYNPASSGAFDRPFTVTYLYDVLDVDPDYTSGLRITMEISSDIKSSVRETNLFPEEAVYCTTGRFKTYVGTHVQPMFAGEKVRLKIESDKGEEHTEIDNCIQSLLLVFMYM